MTAVAKIPPKPGKETVYIDVEDEITTIIDKVDGAKEKVVALVLPKRATVLRSVVNMRLLKRSAEKAGKNVVLITSEEALMPLAGVAGIHVARNLQTNPVVPAAPVGAPREPEATAEVSETGTDEADATDKETPTKLDYHRTVGELAASHESEEAIALDDEEPAEEGPAKASKKSKPPKENKVKVPNFDRFRILVFGSLFLLIVLIVFIVLAIFVLPKATITVDTQSTPVSANLTLNASSAYKNLDETDDDIPAVLKTTQQTTTLTVPATGQQNNGTQATGEVTMTDCVSNFSTTPGPIPSGTGITANGLTYITQNETDFSPHSGSPGGNCEEYQPTGPTDITADAAGSKYNVPSGTLFNVDDNSGASATGSASGGTDDNITVVSQSDVDGATSKLTSASSSTFTKSFESTLSGQGLYVLTSTLKAATPTVTASPAVGQQASNTTVTAQISYTVLAVENSDLTKVVTDALNGQITQGKQKLAVTNVLGKANVTVQSQNSPSSATLSVSESTTAIPTLSVTSIKQQATGQKVGVIRTDVGNLPGVKSVNVSLSPFWLSQAPKPSKIKVILQQVPGSGS